MGITLSEYKYHMEKAAFYKRKGNLLRAEFHEDLAEQSKYRPAIVEFKRKTRKHRVS